MFSLLQVNMVIGILVFNKLVSKDGITDMKLKERAGYASYHASIKAAEHIGSVARPLSLSLQRLHTGKVD